MHNQRLHFVLQTAGVLLILFILTLMIIYAQGVIIPLYFSLLIAILLSRIVSFLENRLGFHRVLAILVTELFAFSLILLILFGIGYQLGRFASDWEAIQNNILQHFHHIQEWVADQFSVSMADQTSYMKQAADTTMSRSGEMITRTLGSITDVLFNLFLLPVLVFLFLFYRNLLMHFVRDVFAPKHLAMVNDTLSSISSVIRSYLAGLLIEIAVVAVLDAGGLLLLGVEYAVLLGLIAAVLNLIPYIGSIIAGILAVLVTLSTSDEMSKVLGVLVVFSIVQFIDNNILMPRIVGGKVKINALVSIVGVIAGGVLAGVPGMFLSIPTIAILKVIFDHSVGMKPWGMLLSDEETPPPPVKTRNLIEVFGRMTSRHETPPE